MRRALWRQTVDRLPVQCNYTNIMAKKLADHFKVALLMDLVAEPASMLWRKPVFEQA